MRAELFRRTAGAALAVPVAAVAVMMAAIPAHAQPFTQSASGIGQLDQRFSRCPGAVTGGGECGQDNARVDTTRPLSVPTIERAVGAVPAVCPRGVNE